MTDAAMVARIAVEVRERDPSRDAIITQCGAKSIKNFSGGKVASSQPWRQRDTAAKTQPWHTNSRFTKIAQKNAAHAVCAAVSSGCRVGQQTTCFEPAAEAEPVRSHLEPPHQRGTAEPAGRRARSRSSAESRTAGPRMRSRRTAVRHKRSHSDSCSRPSGRRTRAPHCSTSPRSGSTMSGSTWSACSTGVWLLHHS